MSNNSTYERYIRDSEHEQVKIWQECLVEQANLPSEMLTPAKWQIRASNWKKPVGLYFDRLDWVREQDVNYPDKDSKKRKSLIESFWHFGRGVCIDPRKTSDYDARSSEVVIQTTVDVLEASEFNERARLNITLESYVTDFINYLDKQIIKLHGKKRKT